ncbi:MAG: triose-phosphate isomerase [Dongiaceae bacterium]
MTQLLIANWKMNGSKAGVLAYAAELLNFMAAEGKSHQMVICPPFPYLDIVAENLDGSAVQLGAQDCHTQEKGAFTGDISAPMLADMGCKYVIVGHSERRQYHGESDDLIAQKLQSAQKAGLIPILCIGETGEERKANKTLSVLSRQLKIAAGDLVIAYEPVWAIGTGLTPSAAEIEAAHRHIRQELKTNKAPILYGGSVKPENAQEIFAIPGVDGALVGGASLKAADFMALYRACR